MKKYFLLLFVLNLMTSCGSDGLETNYSDHDSRSQLPDSDRTEEQGHLLKKVSHRNFGETEFLNDTEFEYDEQERFIKSISHEYSNGESEISSQSESQYDSQGRILKITRHSNYASKIDGLTETEKLNLSGSIRKFIYDQEVTIINYYNLNNELRMTQHIFEVSNNEHHTNQFSADGILENTRIEYRNDGACSLQRVETHVNGKISHHVIYEYLDANCSVRATAFNQGKLSFEDTITKDSENSIIELVSKDSAGIIDKDYSYKNDITYNAQGYPLHIIRTTYEGSMSETLYEYY